jgi:extradiol dioxygenase family protein
VGIVNESEEKAERFYGEFLGLQKTRQYMVPPELSEQLFSISSEIKALVFERDEIKIEVFICPECRQPSPELRHIGLLLNDLQAILNRARVFGVEHIVGKTREKTVHFIRDFSGNLIEVKQK